MRDQPNLIENAIQVIHGRHQTGITNVFRLPSGQSAFFPVDAVSNAAAYAHHYMTTENVYICMGIFGDKPAGGRGRESDVIGLSCLWADLDHCEGEHKDPAKYPTRDECLKVIDGLPVEPSLLIDSGGGFYPIWMFDQPWLFKSDDDRRQAKRFALSWHHVVERAFHLDGGWKIDNVSDLARVLRVPGTINHKYANKPMVEIIRKSDLVYAASDFEEFFFDAEGREEEDTGDESQSSHSDWSGTAEKCFFDDVHEGDRDNSLFKYACRLRAQNLTFDEAKLLILKAATRCKPPFSDHEAIRKLESAWKYSPGKAGAKAGNDSDPSEANGMAFMPDPPPAPMEVFHPDIQQLLQRAAMAFTTPIEVAISALMMLCSACIGRALAISPKHGWVEHANLFWALVGLSGVGKSPLVNAFFDAVYRVEKKWFEQWEQEHVQYLADQMAYQAELKKKKGDTFGLADPPKKPRHRQIIVDDSTLESLVPDLVDNPKGLLWARDELDGLLLDFDKYNGKAGATKTRLMSAYDCKPWKANRKSGKAMVPHACLGIFGTIQPSVLKTAVSQKDRDSGWAARFIMTLARRTKPKQWTNECFDAFYTDAIDTITESMLTIDMQEGDHPRIIQLSSAARKMFIHWYNQIQTEPWRDFDAADADALSQKLISQALRVCLILHVLDEILEARLDQWRPVSADTMRRALILADWIKSHQRLIWQAMGAAKLVTPSPLDRRVIMAILELESSIKNGRLFVKDISATLNYGLDRAFEVNPRSIGRVLKKIGFENKRTNSGRYIEISAEDIGKLNSIFSKNVTNVTNVTECQNIV